MANMQINVTSAKGVLLKTKGKLCEGNIAVIPELEELTVTENGEYTPSKAGYSKVNVNVQASGGGDSLESVFDGTATTASLPNVTEIRKYAFYFSKLTNVSMPKVTAIGSSAFYACSNLALTSLPSGLTSIGSSAFANCTNLALTSLPSNLTSIETYAFSGCKGLKSITFEGQPTTIDSMAFTNCSNLATINVPWAEGAVSGAPWGATGATINYNYTGE